VYGTKYVEDPELSAIKISQSFIFRAILEFLKSIEKKYDEEFLGLKENEKGTVNYLIEKFDKNIEDPEIFYSLKIKNDFDREGEVRKEKTKDMIKDKVLKFLNAYIKEELKDIDGKLIIKKQLDVYIQHAKKKENHDEDNLV
jgi:hypothetical protein